ncbi:MAG: sterol desaturase family protein [Moraxellaceae bacterium]|nr:sterol desaturase family protein [Moraxellaceae bacterium]
MSDLPNIIDVLLDPVSLTSFAIYLALIAWEAAFPARKLPPMPGWRVKGLIAFAAYFLVSTYLPYVWSARLSAWQLLDLTVLGTWGGAAAGLLVYELGAYAYHRSMHRSPLLWRWLHQMHHSAERLDTWSAFWFSPLDMAGWTLVSSLTLTLVIGITPEATVVVLLTLMTLAVFQHSNIRTPRWLGYIVQRPESHSLHHARQIHNGNYADLPVFDMLFGTFHNPRDFMPAVGFYDGASRRLLDMLRGRDVGSDPHDLRAIGGLGYLRE